MSYSFPGSAFDSSSCRFYALRTGWEEDSERWREQRHFLNAHQLNECCKSSGQRLMPIEEMIGSLRRGRFRSKNGCSMKVIAQLVRIAIVPHHTICGLIDTSAHASVRSSFE